MRTNKKTKWQRKPKQPKSICVAAFPHQFRRLHPERSAAGGIRARSASEEVRMAVYRPIAELFKRANQYCQCCVPISGYRNIKVNFTEHIHHTRGRDGLLLFDIRWWKTACADCHRWTDANRDEARRLGLLSEAGYWNKQTT